MVEEFKNWILGSFDNRIQAFSNPSQYAQISLRHVLLPNGMIYGEQKYTVRKEPPYRQFVLDVHQVEDKLLITSYKVKDGNKHLEFKNIEEIDRDRLEMNQDCDCIFIKKDNQYYGQIMGCKCWVYRNGKKSFLYTASILNKDTYKVIDRGYCPDTKKQLWGSEYGMFEFKKQ
jgi:CpeT protein